MLLGAVPYLAVAVLQQHYRGVQRLQCCWLLPQVPLGGSHELQVELLPLAHDAKELSQEMLELLLRVGALLKLAQDLGTAQEELVAGGS